MYENLNGKNTLKVKPANPEFDAMKPAFAFSYIKVLITMCMKPVTTL